MAIEETSSPWEKYNPTTHQVEIISESFARKAGGNISPEIIQQYVLINPSKQKEVFDFFDRVQSRKHCSSDLLRYSVLFWRTKDAYVRRVRTTALWPASFATHDEFILAFGNALGLASDDIQSENFNFVVPSSMSSNRTALRSELGQLLIKMNRMISPVH